MLCSTRFIFISILYCLLINKSIAKIKRSVIYPGPKSKIQLIFGAGFPVEESITVGYVIRCDYRLPTNLSNFEDNIISSEIRRKIDSTIRSNLYDLLGQFLTKFGGKTCILRTICEISNVPFDKNYGFFEEIFHIIFTPSRIKAGKHSLDKNYLAAEHLGKKNKTKCSLFYPECALDLIGLFTKWTK